MKSDDNLEIIDLDDMDQWRVPPLFVYIAVPLTKTLPGDPHLLLADTAEEVLRERGMWCHNPARVTPPGSHHSPAEVYAINYRAVARSDVILFIRIAPSVGMGEEAQIAANQLVPWCQVKANNLGIQPTPVLLGLGNVSCGEHTILIKTPVDASSLRSRLTELITSQSFKQTALRIRAARHRAKGAIEGGGLGATLRRQRLLAQLPLQQVEQRLGLNPRWIDAVERHSDFQCGVTLAQLVYLANALHGRVAICSEGLGVRIEPRRSSFPAELVDHASEFADRFSHGPDDPERILQQDEETQALWRLSVKQKMGREPYVPAAEQLPPVQELQVDLGRPISNLKPEEEERVAHVCDAVTEALEQFSCIRINVTDPRDPKYFIPECKRRHDHREEIYCGSVKRILRADLVVSILSPPATGVGVGSQVHADATIPRIAIVADDPVSHMYTGLFVPLLGDVLRFGPSQDIRDLLHNVLLDNWQMLAQSAALRSDIIRRIARAGVARAIHKDRILRKQTLDEFVTETCRHVQIAPAWLKAIATFPRLTATLTLIQMVHIAQALGWHISISPDGVPRWDVPMHKDREFDSAISNLVVACEESKWSVNDEKLFVEWEKCEKALSMDEHRDARAYTVDFWKNCLFPEQLFFGAA